MKLSEKGDRSIFLPWSQQRGQTNEWKINLSPFPE